MKKIAIVGDTHFGFGSTNIPKKTFFKRIIEPWFDKFIDRLKDEGIEHIIQLGDLFDDRKNIDIAIIDSVYGLFDKMKDFEIYSILGNHDIYYKNSRFPNSSSSLLKWFDNINIIENIEEAHFFGKSFLFVPWITGDEDKKEFFDKIDGSAYNVCIGHFEPSHVGVSGDDYSIKSIDGRIPASFDVVFSGHIHARKSYGIFHYVGTPYPMIWKDYGTPKGFCIYDTETGRYDFITDEPIMIRIDFDNEIAGKAFSDIDFSQWENKIVMVVFTNKTNKNELTKFLHILYDADPISVRVEMVDMLAAADAINDNDNIEFDENEIPNMFESIAQEYAKQAKLDENKMKNIVRSLFAWQS